MASRFQIRLGEGAEPAADAFYTPVTTLEVEENADLPGAIQLTLPIAAADDDLTVVGDDRLAPYSRIAVVVSVDGKPDACIFDGYVLSHQVHLDKGITGSTVRVWGQDVSCLMNLDERCHEWFTSDGAIANAILGGDPYHFATAPENTDDDSGDHPASGHSVMQRATDAQFLRERARRAGKLFRVCCTDRPGFNTGYFITPKLDGEPAARLVLNPATSANVDALDLSWDVARPSQVKAQALLRVRDAVDGGVGASGLRALDRRGLADLAGAHAMKVMLTTSVDDAGELRSRARSVLREAGWFVTCAGEANLARLDDGVLRVASLVQVNGAGKIHSGTYFVWSVRHTITLDAHVMRFVLVRNALGAP